MCPQPRTQLAARSQQSRLEGMPLPRDPGARALIQGLRHLDALEAALDRLADIHRRMDEVA